MSNLPLVGFTNCVPMLMYAGFQRKINLKLSKTLSVFDIVWVINSEAPKLKFWAETKNSRSTLPKNI